MDRLRYFLQEGVGYGLVAVSGMHLLVDGHQEAGLGLVLSAVLIVIGRFVLADS